MKFDRIQITYPGCTFDMRKHMENRKRMRKKGYICVDVGKRHYQTKEGLVRYYSAIFQKEMT